MSNLIIIPNDERENGRTQDSIKYNKDCGDFKCLNDGTVIGECKYCELSTQCRQTDILPNGKTIGMEAHYLPIYDAKGELVIHELFCTGHHDIRPYKELIDGDDKVS